MEHAATVFYRSRIIANGTARAGRLYRRLESLRGHEPRHEIGLDDMPNFRVCISEDKPVENVVCRRVTPTITEQPNKNKNEMHTQILLYIEGPIEMDHVLCVLTVRGVPTECSHGGAALKINNITFF